MSVSAPMASAKPRKRRNPANPITAKPDPLDRNVVAEQYGYALEVLYSNVELRDLFERSITEGWAGNTAKWNAELRNTNWFQENPEYARRAWAARSLGGADWQSQLQNARLAVQDAATQVGADLSPAELDSLSQQYIYQGWYEGSRKQLLLKALAEEIPTLPGNKGLRGRAGSFVDQLRSEALANGLKYDDNWFLGAARSVAQNLTTEDDWRRDIRDQAAGMFPVYADRIRQGMNMYEIASPYINLMAQTLEIAPDQVTLNDPYIREALMGIDEKGNARPMGLWDFEKKLKNDPRWMQTKQASNDIASTATDILQIFGLRG